MKLAEAWVKQSTQHNGQRDSDFWKGVEERCGKKNMLRSHASLKKQWSMLQRNTQTFLAVKSKVEGLNVSGETKEETTPA